MPDSIEVRFCDDSWEKIVQFTYEAVELKNLKQLIESRKSSKSLPLREILKFGRWKSSQHDGVSVSRLLRNSEILLPKPEAAARSDELEARVKKLKIQQQEREYKKMVQNLHTAKSTTGSVRVPMVSGLNFAITVIACVFASSFVLKNIVSDFLLRCAIGFAVGIFLMCIEIFLSVRAIMKQENEDEMLKKKR